MSRQETNQATATVSDGRTAMLSVGRGVTPGRSLTDQISEALREAIVSGELVPGELYSVVKLAEQLSVSRTPMREALLRLADSGLVAVERNRGFRVLRRDRNYVDEVLEVRKLLEVPAAGRAASAGERLAAELDEHLARMRSATLNHNEATFMRHDRAFHRAVLEAAGNMTVVRIVDSLRETIATIGASTVDTARSLEEIVREHIPIRDAILNQDADAACHAMTAHLEHTHQLLVNATGGAEAGSGATDLG